MSGATPRPWHADRARTPDNTGGFDYAIRDSDGLILAETFENVDWYDFDTKVYEKRPAEANAKHIVHCVNLHDDLVTALERACVCIRAVPIKIDPKLYPGTLITQLENLLAKAKSEAA